jgi:hypothetical protein
MSGSSSNQLPSCNNHGGDTNTTPIAACRAAAEKKKRPTSNDTSTLNSELRPKSANDEAATAAKADEGEDTNKRVCTERAKHIGSGNSELLAPEWTRMQYRVCSEGSAACRQDHGQGNPTSDHKMETSGSVINALMKTKPPMRYATYAANHMLHLSSTTFCQLHMSPQ